MRTIGIITVGRSDYGIYLPLLRIIKADPDLRLYLIVAGMHLSPEFGMTANMIESDGFEIHERIDMLLSSDTPEGVAKSMGLGVIGFSQSFARFRPDILVVLGDRFEMFTAALAALPFKIPVAHIHGGELTFGAIDDALRHAMTKLSHIHFVSTEDYRRRVMQLGEEPWRITVSGAPGLDNLKSITLLSQDELESKLGIQNIAQSLLVTFHPVTLELQYTEYQGKELLSALDVCGLPIVFTLPNADTGGRTLICLIREFVKSHPTARIVENMGTQAYFSMMAHALAMVGNSSSGIIEAASFELPVVNIGNRQAGRVRGANIIDVDYSKDSIMVGIHKAISFDFHQSLHGLINPYYRGEAAQVIFEKLKQLNLDDKLLKKFFYDLNLNVST